MWKVISPSICRTSAQRLQQELNEDYPITKEVTLNWGNSVITRTPLVEVFGNKLEAVARSANKALMYKICKKHGTVPVVEHFSGPCFQHDNVLGHNGSGVRYCNRQEDFIPGIFSTKEIKGTEWRVYFAYGKVLEIYKKDKVEEVGDPSSPVHNSHNGWGYVSNPRELDRIHDLKKYLSELAINCANSLELSYGAIDILASKRWVLYVLESNSAPTLITNDLVAKLAKEINRIYGE